LKYLLTNSGLMLDVKAGQLDRWSEWLCARRLRFNSWQGCWDICLLCHVQSGSVAHLQTVGSENSLSPGTKWSETERKNAWGFTSKASVLLRQDSVKLQW
jgi:hypothetical protein